MNRKNIVIISIILVLLLGIFYLLYLYAGRNAREIEIEASSPDSPEIAEPVVNKL